MQQIQPIHEKVLKSFNALNTSGCPHPVDECKIKNRLIYLKEIDCELPSQDLKNFAELNGWDTDFIKVVNEWLEKINSGGRVVIKHKGYELTEKYKNELLSLKESN